jgi:glycosyltransferase involved in cell wall biosynthesis
VRKHIDCDILHAHGYGAFPALYASCAKNSGAFVFSPHYHGSGHSLFRSLLHIPYRLVGKRIFEKSDQIICVSNFERNLIKSHFNINEKKFIVVPNGINSEEFINLKRRGMPRKDSQVVLYVGRLEKYKGVQYLIAVLRRLDENILLEVVGAGPYKKALMKLAHAKGIEARVRFYEGLRREELLQRYASADLFVLLSRHEAYGISVAEALAAGIPCIVANASALQEWVDDKNVFGISYPIDMDELASLITMSMGRKIQGKNVCTWDMVAEDLERTYKRLS